MSGFTTYQLVLLDYARRHDAELEKQPFIPASAAVDELLEILVFLLPELPAELMRSLSYFRAFSGNQRLPRARLVRHLVRCMVESRKLEQNSISEPVPA